MSTLINVLPEGFGEKSKGCDGSALFKVSLNAPAGRREGTIEGGPWNCFFVTASKLEDWVVPNNPASDEYDYDLDDGPKNKLFLGSWMRTGSFSKFHVRDRTGFHFSDVKLTVFLTRNDGFFAYCGRGWF